uniref:Uncharacterized protein n=1 Tax=Timema douglasi TaxID=61478 RepID=A0A7R8VQW2_TIMDO|nr:unnamed protein product [Timema douglasi]
MASLVLTDSSQMTSDSQHLAPESTVSYKDDKYPQSIWPVLNPGLDAVRSLYRIVVSTARTGQGPLNNWASLTTNHNMLLTGHLTNQGHCAEGALWKEGADSSGSETGKQDLEEDGQNHPTEHRNSSGNVKFTVGGDSWAEDGRGSNARGSQRVSMIRCPSLSKSSLSETHLVEQGVPRAPSSGSGRKQSSREHTHQFQHQATVEEEQYSTDSNSTTDDDVRRRKRKLFSGFPRKPKAS